MLTPSRAHFSPLYLAGTSAARSGRSRMCPMLDSTSNSGPRKFLIVRAFAGDSTMTRRFDIGTRVAEGRRCARNVAAAADLSTPRRPLASARLRGLPAGGAGTRTPARGRIRPGREPRVQPRPVAARDPALPAALAPFHGEIGAVLVAAVPRPRRVRRVQGAARRGRRGGDRDGGGAR